jgi:hypothetical protein
MIYGWMIIFRKNIPVYYDNQEYTFGDKTFLIGHETEKVRDMGQTHEKYLQIRFLNGF